MFPRFVVSHRHPFAPSALPDFVAHMGVSDFRSSPLPPSLFRLVGKARTSCAPTIGSPWLPRIRLVRLDADLDPGVARVARHRVTRTVAYWAQQPIGTHLCGNFGTPSFRVSLTCYLCASPPFVPTHQASRHRDTCKARYPARG